MRQKSEYSFQVLDPASEPASAPSIDPADSVPGDVPPPIVSATQVRRRTLPVERLGAFIEVILCSGFPTQILVYSALTGLGLQARTADGGWAPAFVVTMSLTDMVLVLGFVFLFLRAHHEPIREFVLGSRRPLREVALGLALIPGAFMVVVFVLAVLLTLAPELHNVAVNPFERLLQTPRDAAVFAFVVTFAGGVREEVQRGFIIRRFDQYLGGALGGILIYSGIFGLGHLDQGYAAAIATGVLGAMWGALYWSRGSVIAPMVSHAGFNLAQLIKYVSLAVR